MRRYISSSFEIRDSDRIVHSTNPDDMLCISGTGFFFTIFFQNQKALDMFRDGLDKVKIKEDRE